MAERVLNWECEICGLRLKNVTPPVRHKCVSRGLGDTIAKITHATGIAQVVKKVSGGKDCGCRGRQEKLNQMFPYKDSNNGE